MVKEAWEEPVAQCVEMGVCVGSGGVPDTLSLPVPTAVTLYVAHSVPKCGEGVGEWEGWEEGEEPPPLSPPPPPPPPPAGDPVGAACEGVGKREGREEGVGVGLTLSVAKATVPVVVGVSRRGVRVGKLEGVLPPPPGSCSRGEGEEDREGVAVEVPMAAEAEKVGVRVAQVVGEGRGGVGVWVALPTSTVVGEAGGAWEGEEDPPVGVWE